MSEKIFETAGEAAALIRNSIINPQSERVLEMLDAKRARCWDAAGDALTLYFAALTTGTGRDHGRLHCEGRPMTDAQKDCFQSTPPGTLERQIMDACTPKNEREWWAFVEIGRLRAEAEALKKEAATWRDRAEWLAGKDEVFGAVRESFAAMKADATRLDWIANHGGCPFAETDTVWDNPTEFRRALDEQIAHLEGRDSTR